MAKKALCVGINDYQSLDNRDLDLRGCVNDAKDWAALLTDHYDFAAVDITMLLDNEATKAKMLAGIESLLAGAQAGDVLVFTNSSHGTYADDSSGEEAMYDEAMCPCDVATGNLVLDDELRERFANLPVGVSLTIISDSCYSGTATRRPRGLPTPDDVRPRMLYPSEFGQRDMTEDEFAAARQIKRAQLTEKFPESGMNELLLSGCKDDQTSADARIAGDYHGAMTYYAIAAIKKFDYRLTFKQLHAETVRLLNDNHFSSQTPQLEGSDVNKAKQIFT